MSASRDALIAVLDRHRPRTIWAESCECGERADFLKPFDPKWFAKHQADALAQAGIHPFRPDHCGEPMTTTPTVRVGQVWADNAHAVTTPAATAWASDMPPGS